MKEVFGAVLSVKDNVSGVMKQAKESTRGYRGEVEKTKKELEKLDKKKIREKELKIKNSEAYKAIEGVRKRSCSRWQKRPLRYRRRRSMRSIRSKR